MLPTIPRISAILRYGRVPVPHTNEATYALDAEGGRWIAKREVDMGVESLLAEALTWLLARRIGAPVPDAAFCNDPAERAWLSRLIPETTHWEAASADRIGNLEEAGAIHALDAIVCNEARHGRKLLLAWAADGPVRVLAIDADEALIGHPDDLEARGLMPPDPRILAHGLPTWREGAVQAAERAAAISPSDLHLLCEEACAIACEPRVEVLVRVLAARCAVAEDLTLRYLALVEQRR